LEWACDSSFLLVFQEFFYHCFPVLVDAIPLDLGVDVGFVQFGRLFRDGMTVSVIFPHLPSRSRVLRPGEVKAIGEVLDCISSMLE